MRARVDACRPRRRATSAIASTCFAARSDALARSRRVRRRPPAQRARRSSRELVGARPRRAARGGGTVALDRVTNSATPRAAGAVGLGRHRRRRGRPRRTVRSAPRAAGRASSPRAGRSCRRARRRRARRAAATIRTSCLRVTTTATAHVCAPVTGSPRAARRTRARSAGSRSFPKHASAAICPPPSCARSRPRYGAALEREREHALVTGRRWPRRASTTPRDRALRRRRRGEPGHDLRAERLGAALRRAARATPRSSRSAGSPHASAAVDRDAVGLAARLRPRPRSAAAALPARRAASSAAHGSPARLPRAADSATSATSASGGQPKRQPYLLAVLDAEPPARVVGEPDRRRGPSGSRARRSRGTPARARRLDRERSPTAARRRRRRPCAPRPRARRARA